VLGVPFSHLASLEQLEARPKLRLGLVERGSRPAGRHVLAGFPHQIERPELGAVGRRRVHLIDAADVLAVLDDGPVGEVGEGARVAESSRAQRQGHGGTDEDNLTRLLCRQSAMQALSPGGMGSVMLTSAECRALAEQKLVEADQDGRHRRRLIIAAEAWGIQLAQGRDPEA
jgi:hypothetical protein